MASLAQGLSGPGNLDRRLMLWLGGAVLLMIVLVSVFAPVHARDDPRPSIDNAAPGGAKAAFLVLQALHRPAERWDRPMDDLAGVDAPHTTLVLAAPMYTALEKDRIAAALKSFLERGGRVLTTGGTGALLLPGGSAKGVFRLQSLCYTAPEGPGTLARTGPVEMNDLGGWAGDPALSFAEHRCGTDAVVIRVPVGKGEAVWWSSPSALTNAELHRDSDLQLLVLSLGEGRRVLFDESLQQTVRSYWSAARGLPLWWMLAQAGLLFGLLVFSFSRRRGPVRLPTGVPRSSPLEFAVSMGDLYEKAGATGAATEAARRRLLRTLVRDAGLPQAVVAAGPTAIAAALQGRFGGSWTTLAEHLQKAAGAADTNLKTGSALKLAQALYADTERVRAAAGTSGIPQTVPEQDTVGAAP